MDLYLQELMPGITQPGDDNNYGSAAMQDVLCLQALSKRIHYGKFVAEAKYRAQPEQYKQLIKNRDRDAIMQTLTDEVVEKQASCCALLWVTYVTCISPLPGMSPKAPIFLLATCIAPCPNPCLPCCLYAGAGSFATLVAAIPSFQISCCGVAVSLTN